MSETRVKDLIQAKALGCLDTKENATFLHLMEEDNEFPWGDLGQYQNLVAHMPTLLEFEMPDPEIKNRLLQELQNQIEPVQLEEEVEIENIQDLTETIEVIEDEDLIIEEEEIVVPDFQEIDKVDSKKIETKRGISFKKPEKPEFDVNAFKTGKSKRSREQKVKPSKSALEKELPTKKPKNYVSKFSRGEQVTRVGGNKIMTIIGVVIGIILIFLLVMYLGLSSEIDDNKNEIEKLKQRIGLTLIHEESFPSDSWIT